MIFPSLKRALMLFAGCMLAGGVQAQATPEYRAKAGFLYNFIVFTEWPSRVGSPLPLCVYDSNPFGNELDALEGKSVGGRVLVVRSPKELDQLKSCRVVFVTASAIGSLPRILEALRGEPVLTVADSPGAAQRGVALNMEVDHERIVFQANLRAARAAGVDLSSKLLRLATEVRQ